MEKLQFLCRFCYHMSFEKYIGFQSFLSFRTRDKGLWTCTTRSEDKFTVKLILQVFKLKIKKTVPKFEENLNMFYCQRMSFDEILHLFT